MPNPPSLTERLRSLAISLEPATGAVPANRPDKLVFEAVDEIDRLNREVTRLRGELIDRPGN